MNRKGILRFTGLIALAVALTGPVAGLASSKSIHPASFDNGALPPKLADNLMVDSIAIHKEAREMQVFRKNVLLKTYTVHLGINPVGPKRCAGDYKTPEGLYFINCKNPNSQFHKSLGVSYPNVTDRQRSAKVGLSPGGDIMIHGLPNGEENVGPDRYQNDWTWGCIAIRNGEIDELFDHTEVGTPLLITP
jgi:murein L,D-transpeptidase YafK